MIGTYSTIDFGEVFESLKTELDRLETNYRVHEKPRAERVNDYNQLTTALRILCRIKVN